MISQRIFLELGNVYAKSSVTKCESVALRRYKSLFGISPLVCFIVWKKIEEELPEAGEPKHLLWSLHFLRQYSVEYDRHSIFGADEKSVRKWTWVFVQLLSDINVIIWENRFTGAALGQTCFCSLDGVHFEICEPKPFSPMYFNHKFRGPGLTYEIGLNIRAGYMIWAFGGYPCGQYPDLKLAHEAYLLSVNDGEKTVADKGYQDSRFFILPNNMNKALHKLIMSRQETVNKRMRQFRKHPMVFYAVANLTQLMLENGEPLVNVL